MRKLILSCVALALIAVSLNQAFAFGWRGIEAGRHYHNGHCRVGTAAAAPQAEAIHAMAKPVNTAQTDPAMQASPSADLQPVITVIRGMPKREHARLLREIEWLEQDEDDCSSYGAD